MHEYNVPPDAPAGARGDESTARRRARSTKRMRLECMCLRATSALRGSRSAPPDRPAASAHSGDGAVSRRNRHCDRETGAPGRQDRLQATAANGRGPTSNGQLFSPAATVPLCRLLYSENQRTETHTHDLRSRDQPAARLQDTLANCTRDAASTSCSFAQRARLEALALLGVSDVELLRFLSVAAALRPGGLICEPLLALLHGHHVHDARTIVLVRACEAGGGRIMGGVAVRVV